MIIDKEKYLNGNEPSEEQVKLCEFAAHGLGNAIVQARAGCGKSKTIELMCSVVHPRKKILVLAYNRHIAESLGPKMEKMAKDGNRVIDVYTYHQLGLKILHAKIRDKNLLNLDERKYEKYINDNIDNLSCGIYGWLPPLKRLKYKRNIINLIDYVRFNKMQSVVEIVGVAMKYGINLIENECAVVESVLNWGKTHLETIDFTDMIWLPYELGIKANILNVQYDLIFIDEAQDSSLIQQNLIEICKYRKTRMFIFGDENQTINAWCGADDDAFGNFEKVGNTTLFTLNTSYRCSQAVADHVRELIPDFKTPPTAIDGSVNYNVSFTNINVGDMVLCRITSPLIKLHLQLLKIGIPSKVIGHNIGIELIEIIEKSKCDDMECVIDGMYNELFDMWERTAKENDCQLKDVVMDGSIVGKYDEILCMEAAADGLIDREDVISRLKDMFEDESNIDSFDRNTVLLSTVHRAKGLESDNVFILCPSLMPSMLAKTEEELKSETNIMYVARSRAKTTLNYITEKEFPPTLSYLGSENIYKELKGKYDEKRR